MDKKRELRLIARRLKHLSEYAYFVARTTSEDDFEHISDADIIALKRRSGLIGHHLGFDYKEG